MVGASPETEPHQGSATSITDLDADTLANCASFLCLEDVVSMAMSSKQLQAAAYSDHTWNSLFRKRWPLLVPSGFPHQLGAREAYLSRLAYSHQLVFRNPSSAALMTETTPHDILLMDENDIVLSKGSVVRFYRNCHLYEETKLSGHEARISCMRFFPIDETPFLLSKDQGNDSFLVTASLDHSIRIWHQDRCLHSLRGHNGPVSTLSDRLLGSSPGKLIASGGEDGTVRLWSVEPGGKHGQSALKATLHGHDKSVVLLSVARHITSLLVSISENSKVMVWDATTSSSQLKSSSLVGKATVPGTPVGMKCHESLVYVAAGSSVVGIDLRTMHNVLTLKLDEDVHSFQMLPHNSFICTGLTSRAMLWDVRKSSDLQEMAENVAEMKGPAGKITLLHMDSYKIVTGGYEEGCVNVWETGTGKQTNSLNGCCHCLSMAAHDSRIAMTSGDCDYGDPSQLRVMHFRNARSRCLSFEATPSSE
ncbi:unnamed protein product [Cuscuta campestris]|uniref:Uncharacterized protein n=1 Tax=Cuscuta campestris TaxID=132261 RepID=A0A484MU03_9ASTE|nr:unnamed protein product [Cuscuta campestris]